MTYRMSSIIRRGIGDVIIGLTIFFFFFVGMILIIKIKKKKKSQLPTLLYYAILLITLNQIVGFAL